MACTQALPSYCGPTTPAVCLSPDTPGLPQPVRKTHALRVDGRPLQRRGERAGQYGLPDTTLAAL
jgi:hypothetical protein